jgi:hypothetical protein
MDPRVDRDAISRLPFFFDLTYNRRKGRRTNRQLSRPVAPIPATAPPPASKDESTLPIPNYQNLPIARSDIPNLATPLTVDTSLTNGLDIEFTVNQPNSPTLPPFVFQAHPMDMFPTTTSFTAPHPNNNTGGYDHPYYHSNNGYYGTGVWPTSNTTGMEAGQLMMDGNGSYGYYAPTDHGQANQYDDRDRSSPPPYEHPVFDYNNGHSA